MTWRRALALLVAGHQSLPPLGPASSYGQAFNRATGDAIFHSRLRGLAKKYGVPRASTWGGNPVRLVETLMPGAKPATRLGGTGAVAGQTLAGLRELHELFSELKRRGLRVQAWPFDTLHDDGSSHVGCEIYPGHCRRELGEAGRALVRPEWSEHDRDAALTCVWAQGAPLGALLDLRNARSAQRRAARTEGWILGARGTPSASKEIPVNDSKSANDRSLS